MVSHRSLRSLTAAAFLLSFNLVLFELLLTRLFAVVLFAQFAHLALALALLGIGFGAILPHLRPKLLPDEGLERRLAWLILLQGVFPPSRWWLGLSGELLFPLGLALGGYGLTLLLSGRIREIQER